MSVQSYKLGPCSRFGLIGPAKPRKLTVFLWGLGYDNAALYCYLQDFQLLRGSQDPFNASKNLPEKQKEKNLGILV